MNDMPVRQQLAFLLDYCHCEISITIVDPVAEGDTTSDKRTLDHHHLATIVGLGRLGLPCRNRTCVHTISNTGDDSTNDKLREIVGS
jgi:hypothetical protein